MSGKVIRKTRNIEKFIKRIQKLAKSEVESGYFSEQGDHPEAEMSYVDLAYMHSKGEGNFPPRDVRLPTIFALDDSSYKPFINKELTSYLYKKQSLNQTLNDFGISVTSIAKNLFGVPSVHLPSNSPDWIDLKDGDTPLVFEGHLKDAWSYNTSEEVVAPKYK